MKEGNILPVISGKRNTEATHTSICATTGIVAGWPCCRCVAIAPPRYDTNSKAPNTPVRGIIKSISDPISTMPNSFIVPASKPIALLCAMASSLGKSFIAALNTNSKPNTPVNIHPDIVIVFCVISFHF